MILSLYFLIAFIVFFFFWKIYAKPQVENMTKYQVMFELSGFHKAFWGALFWIVAIPMMLLWRILEKLTNNKFN